jgi:hypothetical protein
MAANRLPLRGGGIIRVPAVYAQVNGHSIRLLFHGSVFPFLEPLPMITTAGHGTYLDL